MDKIEFPKERPAQAGNIVSKAKGFSTRIFGITKFILGVCALPLVYSSTFSFLNEFNVAESSFKNPFWSGVIAMVVVYLFIWEPAIIYAKGQKILEFIFNFFKPLVRVAPYVLPVYTIVLFFAYVVLSFIFKGLVGYFVFLFGLSIALHLIFSAKSLRLKKEDFLKANYIFGFSLIYIINLAILSLILSLIIEKFSFVNFANNSLRMAGDIFKAVFKQLF